MMRKNNLKNNQVTSAICMAIAATLFITTPVTAFAETDENITTEATVLDVAQEQAVETEKAIDKIAEAVDVISNEETGASKEDGGEVAQPAVEEVVDKAAEIQTDVSEAKEQVQEAAKELDKAEVAVAAEDEAAKEVVNTVEKIEETVETTQKAVEEAKTTVDAAVEKINEAVASENKEAAQEEAQKAYEEINNKVEETAKKVEEQQKNLEKLTDDYNDAKEALIKAENEYKAAVNNASGDVEEAKEKLNAAKEDAAALKVAVEEAQKKLDKESQAATDFTKDLENNYAENVDWNKQAEVLKAYVMDYYIPQVVGTSDVNSIKFVQKVKGFDRQDYTYYEFSYKDTEGNTVTKYFNLDRVDKRYVEGDPYAKVGSSKDIVVFEKSAEEAGADTYLRELYKNEPWYKNGVINGSGQDFDYVKRQTREGKFRVFAYEEDGVTKYVTKAQIDKDLQDDRTITVDTNGVVTVDGILAHEVIQNKNNMIHDKNVIINTQESDEAMEKFIAEAKGYVDQYKEYTAAVNDAQEATEKAQDEAKKLSDAIDELKDRDNSVVTAAKALGVTDVAAFFKLEIPAEEAESLNKMTLKDAISYLDKLLEEAKDKMDKAAYDLEQLIIQKDVAKQAIEELAKNTIIDAEEILENIEEQVKEKKNKSQQSAGTETVAAESADTENDAEAAAEDADNNVIFVNAQAAIQSVAAADEFDSLDAEENAETQEAYAEEAEDITPDVLGAVLEDGKAVQATDAQTVVENKAEEDQGEVVVIEDQDTALADTVPEEKTEDLYRWWILLLVLLGIGIEELYRRNKEFSAQNN
jgi:DNA repair exonuclease SbcCD ATPase subunit